MAKLTDMLSGIKIPQVVKVRQKFDDTVLENYPEVLMQRLRDKDIDIRPGQRICITGGSRGIVGYQPLMKTIVDFVKSKGAQPFIVPAMGSHGGATAEGQRNILAHLGITEETVGAPILSSMETVQIGETELGLPVYIDKNACEADGIILFNRVKTHTSIRGPHQSGLVKMMAIGLAKHKGAEFTHRLGVNNLPKNIIRVGKVGVEKLKIVAGVATIENGCNGLADVYVLKKEEIFEKEPEILRRATAMVPVILLDEIDALVVTEFGKEISGNGVDPAVVGRPTNNLPNPGPTVHAFGVLRLTEGSEGNASGIGLCDFIPKKLRSEIDEEAMYVNCTTGCNVKLARIPLTVDTEELVVRGCVRTSGQPDPDNVKLVIVRSTKYLDEVYMSRAAVEAAKQDQIEVVGDYFDLEFDADGKMQLFN
ncbi:MAG: lactate racemase domain-containing protein [Candidatus Heteroscillospira sp.]|jgi:hypothetical protein